MKKFKILAICMAVLFAAGLAFAETPSTLKRNVWKDKQTFKHGIQVDGTDNFDINSPINLDDATITATDKITATHIVNKTDEKDIPLNAFMLDDSGTLTDLAANTSVAPGLAKVDGIPAIYFASPYITSPILATIRMPADYVSGLEFRVLISTGTWDAGNLAQLDWAVGYNNDGEIFDAASNPQTAIAAATAQESTIKNAVLSFDLNTSAESAITAGSWVTFFVWNNTTTGNNTTMEIKGVTYRYTATQ